MVELYFLIYRLPKMMTRLARERNRSAVAWTLIAIGTWIAAELTVAFTVGFIHGLGSVLWGWPVQSTTISFVTYVLALAAALTGVTIVSRILTGKSAEVTYPVPPPPPAFENPEQPAIE